MTKPIANGVNHVADVDRARRAARALAYGAR